MAENPSPPPRPGVEFTAAVYKAAAAERAESLQWLYQAGEHALALYVAGVAVECMFGAYLAKVSPEFTSRHNLFELAKESKFVGIVPEALYEKYAENLGIIAVRWSNSHRFRSDAAIVKYLKRAGLDRRFKGDVLKENARRATNAAVELVALGSQLWRT